MGCDIHSYVEKRNGDGTWTVVPDAHPFGRRDYGVFGFLADVRNYSAIQPLAEPRGFPDDLSSPLADEYANDWEFDGHSESWVTLAELLAVDYGEIINDRRVTREIGPGLHDGAVTAQPDDGRKLPLSEFLGSSFMSDLDKLKEYGAPEGVRVVFWFDS